MKTISDLMVKDHAKIIDLLEDFKIHLNRHSKDIGHFFEKFKWNLEKHFFIEEKAIFVFYKPTESNDNFSMMLRLIKEHQILLKKIDEMQDDFEDGKKIDITEIEKLLLRHKNLEDQIFYPMIDQEFEEKAKMLIIERIKEMI